jgi:hypothetical protein
VETLIAMGLRQCPVMNMSPAQAVEVVNNWELPDPANLAAGAQLRTGMEGVGLRLALANTGEAGPTPYQSLLMGLPIRPDLVAGPSREDFAAAYADVRGLVGPNHPNVGSALDFARATPLSRRRFKFICLFFLSFRNGIQNGLSPNDAFQLAKGWLFSLLGPVA